VLSVIESTDPTWWLVRATSGSLGLAPATYLKMVEATGTSVSSYCRALYAYSAAKPDELSYYFMSFSHIRFSEGSKISLSKKEGDWWFGSLTGASGWFPSNYVEEEAPDPAPAPAPAPAKVAPPRPKPAASSPTTARKAAPTAPGAKGSPAAPGAKAAPAPPGSKAPPVAPGAKASPIPPKPSAIPPKALATPVKAGSIPTKPAQAKRVGKALFNFTGERAEDVGVEDGELVDLLDTSDPDWWTVRRQRDGQQGFVPASYVEELFAMDYQVPPSPALLAYPTRARPSRPSSSLLLTATCSFACSRPANGHRSATVCGPSAGVVPRPRAPNHL
jgi:hypothetical protein